MGGKKKNLANRLAKMSEEDRQRYLQHKADQEEEQRRRKEQLINTFLKNKIKREDAFARLNVAKLNENWHQILRKAKCAEMKEEVVFMKAYVDRVLEFKNRTIKNLLDELEEAEEQYTNNFQSHLSYIKKTIDFSKQALTDMHEEYDNDVELRIKEAGVERQSITRGVFEQELHLKTLCYQFDEKSKTELRENHDHYFKIADDDMQRNTREFKEMRDEKERQITQLWLQIGKFIKEYVDKTNVRRAHLAELTAFDVQNGEEIKNNEAQINQSRILLENLEQKCSKMESDTSLELKRLEEYVGQLKSDFLKDKTSTFKKLQEDEANMKFLSEVSNASLRELQTQLEKGEKILQLSLICRKFETEEEHATRFTPISRLDAEQSQFAEEPPSSAEEIDDDADADAPLSLDGARNLGAYFSRVKKMDNFWRYYNKMLIKVMAMRELSTDLEQKNAELKERIKLKIEARVEQTLDEKLLKNSKEARRRLFVVPSSASSLRTNHRSAHTLNTSAFTDGLF